ncbi:MAG TPA: nucleoside deaminase [Solirubrobacteraceae bacterium]
MSSLLQRAVDLAIEAAGGEGGPFGAVVARGDDVLAEGTNRVTYDGDPTAHAEIVAIRAACVRVESFRLDGCVLYSSCEPCPMCLAATWWSRIERVVFAATRDDAAAAGFDDSALYAEVAAPLDRRGLPITRGDVSDARAPFAAWAANPDRVEY